MDADRRRPGPSSGRGGDSAPVRPRHRRLRPNRSADQQIGDCGHRLDGNECLDGGERAGPRPLRHRGRRRRSRSATPRCGRGPPRRRSSPNGARTRRPAGRHTAWGGADHCEGLALDGATTVRAGQRSRWRCWHGPASCLVLRRHRENRSALAARSRRRCTGHARRRLVEVLFVVERRISPRPSAISTETPSGLRFDELSAIWRLSSRHAGFRRGRRCGCQTTWGEPFGESSGTPP